MIFKKNWIYINWKFLYIDISNPKRTMTKIKGIFKPLKCYFKWNTNTDWFPMIWCSKPAYIHIMSVDVGWKDKFDSPRYEYPPAIWIHLFKLNLIWYWELPNEKYMDDYWEQALWYLYYYKNISYGRLNAPDIKKAKESWPWEDMRTKQSSWNDKYLING